MASAATLLTTESNQDIRTQINTFTEDVNKMCVETNDEPEDTSNSFASINLDTNLGSDGTMTVTKGKTKLHLLELYDPTTGCNEEVEIAVPMKIMYDFDPTRGKVTLQSSNSDITSFLSNVQDRALQIAVKHCPHGWKEDDMRDFGKWTFPARGQLKATVRMGTTDATRIFSFNPTTKEYKEADINILKRGCMVYSVIRFRFIWYSADSCGLSYLASTLAVVPKESRGFDFILTDGVSSNSTNRLYTEVKLNSELDFSGDKYVNPSRGNIAYYFNADTFQLPRTRLPFGFQESDENPNIGSIELDVNDELQTFFETMDKSICKGVIDGYARWFGSKPSQLTVETIQEKGMYKSVVRPSKGTFKPRYKLKVYTDPQDIRHCVEIYIWDQSIGTHRKGSVADLTPKCSIVPIVNISNLHFKMGGKKGSMVTAVGLTLHAKRLLVYPVSKITSKKPRFLRNMTQVQKSPTSPVKTSDTEFF